MNQWCKSVQRCVKIKIESSRRAAKRCVIYHSPIIPNRSFRTLVSHRNIYDQIVPQIFILRLCARLTNSDIQIQHFPEYGVFLVSLSSLSAVGSPHRHCSFVILSAPNIALASPSFFLSAPFAPSFLPTQIHSSRPRSLNFP